MEKQEKRIVLDINTMRLKGQADLEANSYFCSGTLIKKGKNVLLSLVIDF